MFFLFGQVLVRLGHANNKYAVAFALTSIVVILLSVFLVARFTSTAGSAASKVSKAVAPSVLLSNWENMMVQWDAKTPVDNMPGISTVRYGKDLTQLPLSSYGVYIYDANLKHYIQPTTLHVVNSKFNMNGTLTTSFYIDYSGDHLQIFADFAVVPGASVIVTKYVIKSLSSSKIHLNLLDTAIFTNLSGGNKIKASYNTNLHAFFIDQPPDQQYSLMLSSFQREAIPFVGQFDNKCNSGKPAFNTPICQFERQGRVTKGHFQLVSSDLVSGFMTSIVLGAFKKTKLYYEISVLPARNTAKYAAEIAIKTPAYWLSKARTIYKAWLARATMPAELNSKKDRYAYLLNLIYLKNSQNPITGAFPEMENQESGSIVTSTIFGPFDAIALDAAGYHASAADFWQWMSAMQRTNGTWYAAYNFWNNRYVYSIYPQYANVGEYLLGLYVHYELTHDVAFIKNYWTFAMKAADFLVNGIDATGFGPQDSGLWGVSLGYKVYSQALYIAGLRAASRVAILNKNYALASLYATKANSILSQVQASYSNSDPGLWNGVTGYYDNSAPPSDENLRIDAGGLALIALGDIDPQSSRAVEDVLTTLRALELPDGSIQAYDQAPAYLAGLSKWQSEGLGPASPFLTLLLAQCMSLEGHAIQVKRLLNWYLSNSFQGYMPSGEPYDITHEINISTLASASSSAGLFILAALSYSNQFILADNGLLGLQSFYIKKLNLDHGDYFTYVSVWRHVPYSKIDAFNLADKQPAHASYLVHSFNTPHAIYIKLQCANSLCFSHPNPFNSTFYLYIAPNQKSPGKAIGLDNQPLYFSAQPVLGYQIAKAGVTEYRYDGKWEKQGQLTSNLEVVRGSTNVVIRMPLATVSSLLAQGSTMTVSSVFDYGNVHDQAAYEITLSYTVAKIRSDSIVENLSNRSILWFYPSRSYFMPGSRVVLDAEIVRPTSYTSHYGLRLVIRRLNRIVLNKYYAVDFGIKAYKTVKFDWQSPPINGLGYLVTLAFQNLTTRNIIDEAYTAVDVSASWSSYPRYGFVSAYPFDIPYNLTAFTLNLYHINAIQFYDWQWKHDRPVAGSVQDPASSWNDIANRTNYRSSVIGLIQAGHARGMAAFNYNLIYGAWSNYQEYGIKKQWGLYNTEGCVNQIAYALPGGWATPYIYMFNPGNQNWTSYILQQEKEVFQAFPFDGWQMDQLGNLGLTYTCAGKFVYIPSTLNNFITAAGSYLNKALVFNAVGQFGQSHVANNQYLVFLYAECWPGNGQITYQDLQKVIFQNAKWSKGKKTVLAAYMDQAYSGEFSNGSPGFFSTPGVILTDAAIFASGGDHIEIGDVNHMLSSPYFPDQSLLMKEDLQKALLNYYNFLVAYESLLRGGFKSADLKVDIDKFPWSYNAEPHHIWVFARKVNSGYVLQLINLTSNSDVEWMDTNGTYRAPRTLHNIKISVCLPNGSKINKAFIASPDIQGGTPQSLDYNNFEHNGKTCGSLNVSQLKYWDMIWLK